MAATVTASSPWGKKPGAWALDAEEHEEELQQLQRVDSPPQNDAAFPSLSVAASVKVPKKSKKMSLAEFTAAPAKPSPRVEVLSLPTGPRQRSAEELEQAGRLGGGFRSYGRGGEDGDSRGGRFSSRDGGREREKEFTPSRSDEVDDWSKTKRSVGGGGGGGFERRERAGGFFEDSKGPSKADESDNWLASKATVEPRRFERRGSFESLSRGREDSDNWGRRKEAAPVGGADSDTWGQRKEAAPFGGADSDNWGRGKVESNGNGTVARPRLVLQPRTAPVASNGNGDVSVEKPKGSSPFGAARPREEVLAEKGKDWKEIDEKLEAVKIGGGAKEAERGERREGYGWRKDHTRFGDDGASLERSWRKPEASNSETIPDSSASSENGHAAENGDTTEDGVAEAN